MAQFEQNGVIYEEMADGNVRVVGYSQGRGEQMPADPTYPLKGPTAQADLTGKTLDNEKTRLETERIRAQMQADAEKAARDAAVNKDLDARNQRIGLLNSLADQLVAVEQLYNKNFRGGWPNFIAGRVQPAEADELNKAASGLLDAGQAAFRIPGSGDQNPQELKFKLDAYLPSPTGTDKGNTQNFAYLRRRINSELASLNQPEIDFDRRIANNPDDLPQDYRTPPVGAPQSGPPPVPPAGPTVLPDARGARGDNVRPSDNAGVTSAGNGLRREPRLAGVGQDLLGMVQAGRPLSDVLAYGDKRFKEAGWPGISPEQRKVLEYAVRYRAANPSKLVTDGVTGWENYEMVPDTTGSSTMGAIATAEPFGVPVGNTLLHATNAATAGLPTYLAGDDGADVMNASLRTMPKSALVGDVAGSIASMVGINKIGGLLAQSGKPGVALLGNALTKSGGVGGDIAYGATRGGMENGPEGAFVNGLAGLVGNKVGGGTVNALGRGIRGVSDPAVRYLADRGIPMTTGQLLGNRGYTGKLINKLESMPVIGDNLAARRAEAMSGWNQAVLDEAGAPIGFSPSGVGYEATEAGMSAAGRAIDNATAGVNIPLDEQFQRELADAVARGEALPPDFAQKFALVQRNKIEPGIQTGNLSGDSYAEMTRGIKGYRAEHQKAGFEGDYRDALTGIQNALDGVVARNAGPDVIDNLGKARTAYRDFKLLDKATGRAQGGSQSGTPEVFTPAQLQTVIRGSKYAQSGTKAPFYDLAKAGNEVLPSTVPNSGTADRGFANMLVPGLLGGGAGLAAYAEPKTAVPLALLAALTTKTGAKVAQKALSGRSPAARTIGRKLINQRRKAGLFGASAAQAMVPHFSQ